MVLKETLFTNACAKLSVTPNIILFASRINCQITPCVSYRDDPAAFAINTFQISWQYHLFYAFPPFSLITTVLQKIQEDKARGLLLVPKWPTQPWVTQVNADVNPTTNTTSKKQRHCFYPATHRNPTHFPRNCLILYRLVRRYLNGKGLLTTATTVMEQSWRSGRGHWSHLFLCGGWNQFSCWIIWFWGTIQCYQHCKECCLIHCYIA